MLKIIPSSPVPIYEQLILEISQMIESGKLNPGEALPPIRKLAKQLDVASNTVARAYMDLERNGLIVSNGRKGSFVREGRLKEDTRYTKIFKEPLLHLIRDGYDQKEIIKIFNNNLREIFD